MTATTAACVSYKPLTVENQEAQMKILRLFFMAVTMSGLALAMQACAFTAGAVAGAAGGEALEEEGYELESPIQKDDDN